MQRMAPRCGRAYNARLGARPLITLDLVNTLAVAGLVLLAGHALQRRVGFLSRYNIPAPVIGGLLVAVGVALLRSWGREPLRFDATLQAPLMIAFFTSIGFGASATLLRAGGPALLVLLALATAGGVLQNLVGALVAVALGQSPLLGVVAGSLTLTGGPATGLAFAPLFEEAGVHGAATLATASAMAGIVSAGIAGNPLGTWLIERRGLRPIPAPEGPGGAPAPIAAPTAVRGPALVRALVALLVAMAAGSWLSRGIAAAGVTLPAYVGAMVVAAGLRAVDDLTGRLRLEPRLLEDLGHGALSFFLAMALMTLKLWELQGLALPLLVILAVQVVLMVPLCLGPAFRLMGRDYDAAVAASGFCGFMLGITANAMANMEALVERYGPAPRAFLVVPIVGAFFIDFTNALVITVFLNLWG
jgi:ESS family glutamate:Na+ symporter